MRREFGVLKPRLKILGKKSGNNRHDAKLAMLARHAAIEALCDVVQQEN